MSAAYLRDSDASLKTSKRIPVSPRTLESFRDPFELSLVMLDALEAHKGYYEAGFLHGNVNVETIIILETPGDDMGPVGTLLDLDDRADLPPEESMEFFLRMQHAVYNLELRGKGDDGRSKVRTRLVPPSVAEAD